MRRVHLIIGLLGVAAFVVTGQAMKHHHPRTVELADGMRMMYVSRHIYLLGASLVNVVLGVYLRACAGWWRRRLQQIGSALILLAPVGLLAAFIGEPGLGLAGRSWRSYFALIGLFAGVMMHVTASVGVDGRLASEKQEGRRGDAC